MIIIRTLPKPEMGIWIMFLVVTSIFEITKSGLIKNAHIRYVSSMDNNTEKTTIASSSFIINAGISILFILFILFLSNYLSYWLNTGIELSKMLVAFIPGLLGMVFFSHFEAVQQSHLDFKGVFAGHFIRQFLFFIIVLVHFFLSKQYSLVELALYQGGSIIMGTVVLYIYSKKYLLHRFDPTIEWIKKILGYGGYIFSSGIVSNIVANVDQIMISKFLSPTSVAYYGTASRINLLVDIPSYAASEIIFPKTAKASVMEGKQKVKYLYERMVAILLCFTIPAAIFVILFPKFIISIIATSSFFAAAPILQLYMVTGFFRPMQNQAANLLNSIGKQALCFYMNTIALCLNLVINYICLLRFGFYGAAIGTLITLTIISIAWYFIMKKQIGANILSIFRYMKESYINAFLFSRNLILKRRKVNL